MNRLWKILGIEPTKDINEIRSAFREKSKDVHPEEFPEEFRELKDAYKFAMEYAKDTTVAAIRFVEDIKEEQKPEDEPTVIDVVATFVNDNPIIENNEDSIISIFMNSKLSSESLQLFLNEFEKQRFYEIENDDQRVSIQDIIQFLEEIDFIHNDNTSTDVIVLKEIYYKKIENVILQYCNQIYTESQCPKLDQPRKLLRAIEYNSQYLEWVLPRFNDLCKSVSKGNKLYLNEFSKYNFFELYEYSLVHYRSENDESIRDKYYRIIMLYQLLEMNDTYKFDDLLYLLYANESNADILLLMYEYGKEIQIDKAYVSETEIIERHMPYEIKDLTETIDRMYYLYLPYETYCDQDYLETQIKIVKDYALNKELYLSGSRSSVVQLIFEQWKRWENLKDFYNTGMRFDEYVIFVNDLIEATWEVIKSEFSYKVTREKYPEMVSHIDELLDLMNEYSGILSKQGYSSTEVLEVGSRMIPKLLSVYLMISSAQRREIFSPDTERFKLLGSNELILGNADRLYKTGTLIPVPLIKDNDYKKFKKDRQQVSWYDEDGITIKSKSAKKKKSRSYDPKKAKMLGAIAVLGVILFSVRVTYMQSIGSSSKSNTFTKSPVISEEAIKEARKNQMKETQEESNKTQASINNMFTNDELSQVIYYKEFLVEVNNPEKISDGTLDTTILKRLNYTEADITKFKENLRTGNVEETNPIIEHVHNSRDEIVDKAVLAFNSLLSEKDYSKLDKENINFFDISEERYQEIREERSNGNNEIAREIIEECLDGY